MIEAEGLRIYIDPYRLPSNYTDLPADAILVTHPHGDHYHGTSIRLVDTDDTVYVFPANMSSQVAHYNATGVVPGSQLMVGTINITAFYMYTWAPEGYDPSHPPEANWTSYIIDINGFRIFHAGDSKQIPEYRQLEGQIDVAMLPLGPGCQSMAGYEVVEALQMIDPDFFIPIHYTASGKSEWMSDYCNHVNNTMGCHVLNMEYFTDYTFQISA
jgi:L-ascorbate metabolism protein UlaG (beta-lactamase superfamily)